MAIIDPPPGALSELTDRRTASAKWFAMQDGTIKVIAKMASVHFFDDDNTWKDIDLSTTVNNLGQVVASALPYRFRLLDTGVGFEYRARSGGTVHMELLRAGTTQIDRNATYAFTRSGRFINFDGIATDLHIQFAVNRDGLNTFRVLDSSSAPKAFRWLVIYDDQGANLLDDSLTGYDNSNNTKPRDFPLNRRLNLSLTKTPTTAPAGFSAYLADEVWNGQIEQIDPATHIRSWTTGAIYPVTIDPDVTVHVSADSDNGYQYGSSGNWFNAQAYGGHTVFWIGNNFVKEYAGIRFASVGINQGASLASAVLKMNVVTKLGNYGGGNVYGIANDNPVTFSTANKPTTRTLTTAYTSWPRPTGSGIVSSDVTSVVQEIINRAGFANGNAIGFVGKTYEITHRQSGIEGLADAGTNEPTLELTLNAAAAAAPRRQGGGEHLGLLLWEATGIC